MDDLGDSNSVARFHPTWNILVSDSPMCDSGQWYTATWDLGGPGLQSLAEKKAPFPTSRRALDCRRDYNVSFYKAICDVIHALNQENFHTSAPVIVTAEAQACGKSPFIINWSPFCLGHSMGADQEFKLAAPK